MSAPPAATYGCVHLFSTDTIKIANFPNEYEIGDAIRAALKRCWTPGIAKEGTFNGGGLEWKLKGKPWYGYKEEGTMSRRLLATLFYEMSAIGWHIFGRANLTNRGDDKDTLIFKSGPKQQRFYFPVAFTEGDKIRIYDSPSEQVTNAILEAAKSWPSGIQDQRERLPGIFTIKFKGIPWNSQQPPEVIASKVIVCEVLRQLEGLGYELVASIDLVTGQGSKSSIVADVDTWYFGTKVQAPSLSE